LPSDPTGGGSVGGPQSSPEGSTIRASPGGGDSSSREECKGGCPMDALPDGAPGGSKGDEPHVGSSTAGLEESEEGGSLVTIS